MTTEKIKVGWYGMKHKHDDKKIKALGTYLAQANMPANMPEDIKPGLYRLMCGNDIYFFIKDFHKAVYLNPKLHKDDEGNAKKEEKNGINFCNCYVDLINFF